MTQLPGSLVTTEWLQHHLGVSHLLTIDIRGYVNSRELGGGKQEADYVAAKDEYAKSHLPGAVFVDWTQDIVDPDDPVKVQIAQPDQFQRSMEAIGVGDDTDVVIVDHTGGSFATRLWWALRYYGHDNAALLDGGFKKWVAEDRPVTDTVPSPSPQTFTPYVRPELRASWEDVQAAIGSSDNTIVDARHPKTFRGEDWRGSRAGRIPSAVNVPSGSFLNEDGTWKSPDDLAEIVARAGIQPDQRTISYCNGGVTATAVQFALYQTGNENAAVYDGSWNEWGEREDLPVETGDRPAED